MIYNYYVQKFKDAGIEGIQKELLHMPNIIVCHVLFNTSVDLQLGKCPGSFFTRCDKLIYAFHDVTIYDNDE